MDEVKKQAAAGQARPFLSIIVPVYNVENYLGECLDSLLEEAREKPVEILLVDDGSTDGSGALCREYAEKHPQIRAIRQENSGASAARNAGLDLARGEYVQFVDSDDWLETGALDRIFAELSKKPDVLLINLNRYREGKKTGSTGWKSRSLQQGQRAFLEQLIRKEEVYNVVVSPILRRSWQQAEGFRFLEGIIHEDMEWVPHLLCRAESTCILDEPVYAYRLGRGGSVMTDTGLEKHRESLLLVARTLVGESSEYEADARRFALRAAGLCLFMAMEYAADQGREEAKALEKELKGDLLLAPALRQLPQKYRLCCLLGGGLAGGMEKYRRWQKKA